MEFKRSKETGVLEAWKDGKKIGDVSTMGDNTANEKNDKKPSNTKH